MDDREDFDADVARRRRARADLLDSYPPEAGTDFAIFRDPKRPEYEYWLHRTTGRRRGWRVTSLIKTPEWAHSPFTGHTERDTYEEALEELARERAVFESRNTNPELLDPSQAFANVADADIRAERRRVQSEIDSDLSRGGHNRVMYSALLFAIEQEMWRRGLLRRNPDGYFALPGCG